jgi:hypothetical protein
MDETKPIKSLAHYGLPELICKNYQSHAGITELYDWQAKCLKTEQVCLTVVL